jgi:precorrin-2 dehydrogenase / sirohydrochlorin ferrochelatase
VRYYPINLDINKRACLVVGGGRVGARKVKTLLECGADVTVVSTAAAAVLVRLAAERAIRLEQRPYRTEDVVGKFLVIGATDDEALNMRIHTDAERRGILCNIADRPSICNFILPAIVRRGDFVMAISTAGKSPAFAKHIRKRLESEFGPEYGQMLDLMGAIRTRLLAEDHAPEAHKPLFEALIDGDLLGLIKEDRPEAIDRLLARVLGPDYRYAALMDTGNGTGE